MTVFFIDPDQVAPIHTEIIVYPADGGSGLIYGTSILAQPSSNIFTLSGSALDSILELNITKTIAGDMGSQLSASLAPQQFQYLVPPSSSLAKSNQSPNTLAGLITPFSTIAVNLIRGSQHYPVFFGVVTDISEGYIRGHSKVERIINLEAVDLLYYFKNFAYYTLSWLGASTNLLENLGTEAGVNVVIKSGLVDVPPEQVAVTYYNEIMTPYLANSTINVDSSYTSLPLLISYAFGNFQANSFNPMGKYSEEGITFPFSPTFYAKQQSWQNVFKGFFGPSSMYEVFFQTLQSSTTPQNIPNVSIPVPDENTTGISSVVTSNTSTFNNPNFIPIPIRFPKHPETEMLATYIARQNPFPFFEFTQVPDFYNLTSIINIPSNTIQLNRTLWDNLGQYRFDTYKSNPIIESRITFSAQDARSFYVVRPDMMPSMFKGKAISDMYMLSYTGTMVDLRNYRKFGYLLEEITTQWFSANLGTNKKIIPGGPFQMLGTNVLMVASAYWSPLPHMASGTVEIPLSPSILPGNRIILKPFVDGTDWEFYITGVNHNHSFGKSSTTQLQLARGLPRSLYESNDQLTLLLQGLLERSYNGYNQVPDSYTVTLPDGLQINGLTFITPIYAKYIFQKISPLLNIPQGG